MVALMLGSILFGLPAHAGTAYSRPIRASSSLITDLPRLLARSQRTWSKGSDDDVVLDVLAQRKMISVSFRGTGILPLAMAKSRPQAWSESDQCSSWVFSSFLVGRDTIRFTTGNAEETCTDSPRMIFRDGSGRRSRVAMSPLYGWNVEAIWVSPHHLVFAGTAHGESALPKAVRILIWELGTGRWFASLLRGYDMHRPGFDLPSLLTDWNRARLYETGDALVLRGATHGLLFRPANRSWGLVDGTTGRSIGPTPNAARRQLLKDPQKRIPSALVDGMRRPFVAIYDRANRDLLEFKVWEVVRGPCAAHPRDHAVIVRALGRDRKRGGPKFDPNRELFGVFLVDPSFRRIERTFPAFPTHGWLDTTAYFDLDASADSIVVWTGGMTYSEEGSRYAYACGK
jgi:hypothetical protein